MNWGIVGGRDYEAQALTELLRAVPPSDTVIVGSGIGSERFVREQARDLGITLEVPALRPDLYDWDPEAPVEVGEPPRADTRLLMLARLDQVIAYGNARKAQREGTKIKATEGSSPAQVTDVVVEAFDGKLVLLKGGRPDIAREIVSRLTEVTPYGNQRGSVKFSDGPWQEVIEL